MEVFNKHSIYSEIRIYTDLNQLALENEMIDKRIISVGVADNIFIIEFVKDESYKDYCIEKQSTSNLNNNSEDNKQKNMPTNVKAALDIKLNEDPFYMGCSGLTLKEIYKDHKDWWDKAQKELKNQYIRGKIEIIDEYVRNL